MSAPLQLGAGNGRAFESLRVQWGDVTTWLTRCDVHGISAVDVDFFPVVCGKCLFVQWDAHHAALYAAGKATNYAHAGERRKKAKRKPKRKTP